MLPLDWVLNAINIFDRSIVNFADFEILVFPNSEVLFTLERFPRKYLGESLVDLFTLDC